MTFEPNQDPGDPVQIQETITRLGSPDNAERRRARLELVMAGKAAVPDLIRTLENAPSKNSRKEAAKALGEINDPQASKALVDALKDTNFEVRWAAGESLVDLGSDAMRDLLIALQDDFSSHLLQEGARHVLQVLRGRDDLSPPLEHLYKVLDGTNPDTEVGWAANQAYVAIFSRSE